MKARICQSGAEGIWLSLGSKHHSSVSQEQQKWGEYAVSRKKAEGKTGKRDWSQFYIQQLQKTAENSPLSNSWEESTRQHLLLICLIFFNIYCSLKNVTWCITDTARFKDQVKWNREDGWDRRVTKEDTKLMSLSLRSGYLKVIFNIPSHRRPTAQTFAAIMVVQCAMTFMSSKI